MEVVERISGPLDGIGAWVADINIENSDGNSMS
jgi:hypothetical protein